MDFVIINISCVSPGRPGWCWLSGARQRNITRGNNPGSCRKNEKYSIDLLWQFNTIHDVGWLNYVNLRSETIMVSIQIFVVNIFDRILCWILLRVWCWGQSDGGRPGPGPGSVEMMTLSPVPWGHGRDGDWPERYILYLRDIVSANIQIMPASLSHHSPSSSLGSRHNWLKTKQYVVH